MEWLEEWEGVKRRQLHQWGWEGKEGAGSSWRGMWRGREGLLKERELSVLTLTGPRADTLKTEGRSRRAGPGAQAERGWLLRQNRRGKGGAGSRGGASAPWGHLSCSFPCGCGLLGTVTALHLKYR